MKINHIVNNAPAAVPTKDATSGSTRAASTTPASTAASGSARHSGDTPSLSVQRVSRQVGSGDFDAARVEQIRSAIQSGTLKMDAGKIADAALSAAQSLLSTRSKKV